MLGMRRYPWHDRPPMPETYSADAGQPEDADHARRVNDMRSYRCLVGHMICESLGYFNRLIQMLHDRGLTRYDGVLIAPPIRNDPEAGQAKHVEEIPLSQLADAALVPGTSSLTLMRCD
jgi:hypothetical protein